MKLFLKKLYKTMYLWAIGGLLYCLFELLFRGHTHWTMFAVGGFCFVMCGLLNEHIGWDMPFPLQMLIGCLIITGTELIAGIVLNFLSAVAIALDDELRYNMFGEEKPHYYFWRKK